MTSQQRRFATALSKKQNYTTVSQSHTSLMSTVALHFECLNKSERVKMDYFPIFQELR